MKKYFYCLYSLLLFSFLNPCLSQKLTRDEAKKLLIKRDFIPPLRVMRFHIDHPGKSISYPIRNNLKNLKTIGIFDYDDNGYHIWNSSANKYILRPGYTGYESLSSSEKIGIDKWNSKLSSDYQYVLIGAISSVEITGIRPASETGEAIAEYTYNLYNLSAIGTAMGFQTGEVSGSETFVLYDDGWRIKK